ncbi:HAMP domain-containing sensor histidine kinase [Frondihabitans peucedani]|uniref:histidine kinase n=1 Tax=Frondihabitans peucedani TaxID=598626 RepID=A0ABP8E1X7_9MICO
MSRAASIADGKRRIADARPAHGLRTGSLRLRAVVAILLLLVILLGALAVTVEATLGTRLRAQIEDRLRDRASAATALVGTVSSDELAERLSFQGLSVLIRDRNGDRVVAGPSPEQLRAGPKAGAGLPGPKGAGSSTTGSSADPATPGSPAAAPAAGKAAAGAAGTAAASAKITSSTITADDQLVTLVSKLSDGSTITLTADASSVGQTLAQLRWVMLAASAAFLLIAAVGLVLVVRASLRPLDRVTAVARSIAGGDRGRRLHPRSPRTEIGRVALAFDEMLDAVEGAETKALEAEARVRAFVSDAAHELRTPVAGMRAAADTLVRSPVDREGRERLAGHVAREASRASRLIDDMLMMARVDRGLELELVTVDLGAVVLAEVERQRLRRPSLDLRVEIASARSCATVDPDRIAQIVGNLLDNAARATGYTGRVDVELRADDDAEQLSVDVSDDGPGVPEADRERVFDRLVRLDAGRDQASGGAGLGLPIARGIARAHGGDVVCLPSTHGARFRLTVPQTTTPTQDPALATPADAPAHAG